MEKLYHLFRKSVWVKKTEAERLEVLQALEAETAGREGRAGRAVVWGDCLGFLGLYDVTQDSIVINRLVLNSAGLAACVTLHQGRHAYQTDVIRRNLKDAGNAAVWAQNFNGYLNPASPDVSPMQYYLQPVEQDAWNFGIKQLEVIAKQTRDWHILNDLRDLKLTLAAQSVKAQRIYGRDFSRVIQGKIDMAYAQKQDKRRFEAQNSCNPPEMQVF